MMLKFIRNKMKSYEDEVKTLRGKVVNNVDSQQEIEREREAYHTYKERIDGMIDSLNQEKTSLKQKIDALQTGMLYILQYYL